MTEGFALAGRFRRLVATVIDVILVPSLTLVLVMIAGVVEDAEDYMDYGWIGWVLLLAILSYLLLNGYGLWRHGQTLGKRMMGVAIVPAVEVAEGRYGGTPAPLWKLIFIRAWFFPLLFLSVVPWIAVLPIIDQLTIFSRRRQCVHDLVCGTVVVRLDP